MGQARLLLRRQTGSSCPRRLLPWSLVRCRRGRPRGQTQACPGHEIKHQSRSGAGRGQCKARAAALEATLLPALVTASMTAPSCCRLAVPHTCVGEAQASV